MDIITHAMAGAVIAIPVAPSHPATAVCIAIGSVLPDTDAVSRLFGKRAFLRSHQTFTHSLPVIAAVGIAALVVWRELGLPEPYAPLALVAAMLAHSLMDATNTYGAALLWPFRRRRFSEDVIFFVDAVTLVVTGAFLAVSVVDLVRLQARAYTAVAYGAFLAAWWLLRGLVARRARRIAPPAAESLVPSALVPWRFYGYVAEGDSARTFALSVLASRVEFAEPFRLLDRRYLGELSAVPEYRLMRELSPGYHAVDSRARDGGTEVLCRDLRTRNFGGRFGALDVTFDRDGRVRDKVFHV